MKFFGRTNEILFLRRQRALSHDCSRFTVVTGRRRVGKTELITQALGNPQAIDLNLLEKKALRFFEKNSGLANLPHRCLGLSLNEM